MTKTKKQEVGFLAISEINSKLKATLKEFDCDDDFLNKVAKHHLLKQDEQSILKGMVAVSDGRVVGYVTTKALSLASDVIDKKGLPKKLPVICLEHIATDVRYRDQNIGKRLLQRAFRATVDVAELTGVYGLILWSHPGAKDFYKKHGFAELTEKTSGSIQLTLMFLSVETIRSALNRSAPRPKEQD